METPEEKKELETLLDIVINQIPSYTNMVNSANWDVNSEDCIFGMVYHSFIAKSTEYLKNKLTDNSQETNAESTFGIPRWVRKRQASRGHCRDESRGYSRSSAAASGKI